MGYIKSCLVITMLLGVGLADCPVEVGDMNGDGLFNIMDVVNLATCVLTSACDELEWPCRADLDCSGDSNVLDIILLVNCIVAGNCVGECF